MTKEPKWKYIGIPMDLYKEAKKVVNDTTTLRSVPELVRRAVEAFLRPDNGRKN